MRGDAFVDAGLLGGQAYRFPDHLRRDRRVSPPAMVGAGEEIGLRPHPSVVLAQCGKEGEAEGNLAVATAFALLDPEDHASAINVADFEAAGFAATQAGAVERQQQRPVIEILRAGDEPLDLVRAEHDRQTEPLFRIRQVLADVPPVQDVAAEEPARRSA